MIEEAASSIESFKVEREHRAGATLLPTGDLLLRMGGQAGIVDLAHFGMRVEMARDGHAVSVVLQHADRERLDAARRFLNHVKLCSLAESLGGVETLISLPAMMTHASMPKEVQERVGITEGLVRLSVGIEDVEDIVADLDQALLYV